MKLPFRRYPSPDGIEDRVTITLDPARVFPTLAVDGQPVFLTADGHFSFERTPGGAFLGYAESDVWRRIKRIRVSDNFSITP